MSSLKSKIFSAWKPSGFAYRMVTWYTKERYYENELFTSRKPGALGCWDNRVRLPIHGRRPYDNDGNAAPADAPSSGNEWACPVAETGGRCRVFQGAWHDALIDGCWRGSRSGWMRLKLILSFSAGMGGGFQRPGKLSGRWVRRQAGRGATVISLRLTGDLNQNGIYLWGSHIDCFIVKRAIPRNVQRHVNIDTGCDGGKIAVSC